MTAFEEEAVKTFMLNFTLSVAKVFYAHIDHQIGGGEGRERERAFPAFGTHSSLIFTLSCSFSSFYAVPTYIHICSGF
jgi:hypothetical protein